MRFMSQLDRQQVFKLKSEFRNVGVSIFDDLCQTDYIEEKKRLSGVIRER